MGRPAEKNGLPKGVLVRTRFIEFTVYKAQGIPRKVAKSLYQDEGLCESTHIFTNDFGVSSALVIANLYKNRLERWKLFLQIGLKQHLKNQEILGVTSENACAHSNILLP